MNAQQENRARQGYGDCHTGKGCRIMSKVVSTTRKWGWNNAINWRKNIIGRGHCKCKILNLPRQYYPLESLSYVLSYSYSPWRGYKKVLSNAQVASENNFCPQTLATRSTWLAGLKIKTMTAGPLCLFSLRLGTWAAITCFFSSGLHGLHRWHPLKKMIS